MLTQDGVDARTVESERGVGERLDRFSGNRDAPRAMAQQELGNFMPPTAYRVLVERVFRKARVTRRLGVRAGAVLETPGREIDLVVTDRVIEEPPRSATIPAHVEHLPLGIT